LHEIVVVRRVRDAMSDDARTAMPDITTMSSEQLADALSRVTHERDEYKRRAEFLLRELERLRDLQKTPREHVDAAQIQLAFAQLAKELLETMAPPPAAEGGPNGGPPAGPKTRKSAPHGRAVLPEHLPVRTISLAPDPLPHDAVFIRNEVSWRLGYTPASFYRLKLVRPIFAVPGDVPPRDGVTVTYVEGDLDGPPAGADCVGTKPADDAPCDDGVSLQASQQHEGVDGVVTTTIHYAPVPDEMIARGLPTADLLARIITGKFADKLPFHRQEAIFARSGVSISRATMCGWAERCHELARRVVEAMIKDSLEHAHYISTDATGVLVQANERCKRGHFWVLVAEQDHVVFRYSQRHTKDEPKKFLAGYRGIVLADASSVYDALFLADGGPTEAGCLAHARRYFFKALASDATRAAIGVGFINKLFEIEREIAKLPPDKKLAIRRQRAGPITEALDSWRRDQLASGEVHDGTPIRRALNYLGNHWNALTRFLTDGKIPIHNNRSELELRRLVVGRANWLFVGSDDSAEWTCTFASLIASCELHRLDPEAYLRDLFRLLPTWPRFLELAPKNWAATRARLDLDALALPLGPVLIPPRPTTSNEAAKDSAAGQAVAHEK
jgi:hypothetical protein